MPDEHMCPYCKKEGQCNEQKEREKAGEIVIDCENFEEAGWK